MRSRLRRATVCRQMGGRLTKCLARTGPPTIRERHQGEHEERRIARTPEAKQKATGDAQAGSRSAFIIPLTAGNWAHRDPREGRGATGREPLPGNTGGDLGLREPVHETTTDSRTGEEDGGDNTSVRFSTGESRMASSTPTRAKLSCEEPDAGNLHVRVCVQRRLACSAGERPAGQKSGARSLDSRVAGDQDSEAYRQRLLRGDDEPPGRNESKRECGLESA